MKKAFTMLELVFVIVIIGILSVALAPTFQKNSLHDAANQIVSHIRYTQHLAMMDNKFNPTDPTWYKKRWQIFFQNANIYNGHKISYTIFSNTNKNANANSNEIAQNPLNSKQLLSGGTVGASYGTANVTKTMNIGEEYGITSVSFSSNCSAAKRIAFDSIGRPIKRNVNSMVRAYQSGRVLLTPCDINLTSDTSSIVIRVEPETWYTHIL